MRFKCRTKAGYERLISWLSGEGKAFESHTYQYVSTDSTREIYFPCRRPTEAQLRKIEAGE